MTGPVTTYDFLEAFDSPEAAVPRINLPKTRASKIIQFQHYPIDAPI